MKLPSVSGTVRSLAGSAARRVAKAAGRVEDRTIARMIKDLSEAKPIPGTTSTFTTETGKKLESVNLQTEHPVRNAVDSVLHTVARRINNIAGKVADKLGK